VDEIVIFNPLGKAEIGQIIDLQLECLRKLLAERKVKLDLTDQARQLLLEHGYDPQIGARPLRRAIQRLIQDSLAMKLLEGDVLSGDTVLVDGDLTKGEMTFERKSREAPSRKITGHPEARKVSKN
jgi:ATP-dependent Clp protease ATP-binding subunit ClpB